MTAERNSVVAIDNTFWAFISLLIFLALIVYLRTPGRIGRSLDKRAAQIRNEIDEAQALKEEAKQQLAEYQRRRREAEVEAKDILAAAQREANALVADARRKSEDYVARRAQIAEQKISQAEADAVAEVRASAVNLAVDAATRLIAERGAAGDPGLTDRSIAEVRSRLN